MKEKAKKDKELKADNQEFVCGSVNGKNVFMVYVK